MFLVILLGKLAGEVLAVVIGLVIWDRYLRRR
jgi:ethanolamine transporter EutH